MTNKKELFILLPGWTRSQRTYRRFIAQSPENVEIHCIDYGQITKQNNPNSLSDDLFNFLNEHNFKDINLIGHSLGGALATDFCLKYPKLIKKLYLINAAGIYGKETPLEILSNQTRNLFLRNGKKVIRSITNSNWLTINPIFNITLGFHAHKIDFKGQTFPKRFPPTIIFWGDKDIIHPLWQGEELHKLIPNSKLKILTDEGHDWLAYSPEKFWSNIT